MARVKTPLTLIWNVKGKGFSCKRKSAEGNIAKTLKKFIATPRAIYGKKAILSSKPCQIKVHIIYIIKEKTKLTTNINADKFPNIFFLSSSVDSLK